MNNNNKKKQAPINREKSGVEEYVYVKQSKDSKSKNARARGPWFVITNKMDRDTNTDIFIQSHRTHKVDACK